MPNGKLYCEFKENILNLRFDPGFQGQLSLSKLIIHMTVMSNGEKVFSRDRGEGVNLVDISILC
jgi:hypothetical protein